MTPLQLKLKERREELSAGPKRSLGQNFLVNENVVQSIIRAARVLEPEFIVEVGPGLGSLTDELIKLQVSLTLIELDYAFTDYWKNKRAMSVVCEDALVLNWEQLNLPEGWVLVSNLPYQISSSLLIDRTLEPLKCRGMVLMFQKEVAQRVTAQPRTSEYGLLSVVVQPFWQIEKVVDVGPASFWPPPRVSSRVLKFVPKQSDISDRTGYLSLVKNGFSQRRKFVRKNLKNWVIEKAIPFDVFEEVLSSAQVSENARAEELSVSQWTQIYHGWKTWESN